MHCCWSFFSFSFLDFFYYTFYWVWSWKQSYLQSTTVRIEEWRIKKTDTEQWMRHRQLPPDLRQYVRRYEQYRWLATRGVDEEALLNSLPMDLRRDIKRHLCLDLVRRVSIEINISYYHHYNKRVGISFLSQLND